jgi:hypothetical protein
LVLNSHTPVFRERIFDVLEYYSKSLIANKDPLLELLNTPLIEKSATFAIGEDTTLHNIKDHALIDRMFDD